MAKSLTDNLRELERLGWPIEVSASGAPHLCDPDGVTTGVDWIFDENSDWMEDAVMFGWVRLNLLRFDRLLTVTPRYTWNGDLQEYEVTGYSARLARLQRRGKVGAENRAVRDTELEAVVASAVSFAREVEKYGPR